MIDDDRLLLPGRDFVRTPAGLILPEAVAEQQFRAARMPTGIDLFCGVGGFSLGAIQAGFEMVAAVENDETAAVTYMTNLCRYGQFGLHFVTEPDRQRFERYLAKSYRKSGLIDAQGELLPGSKIKQIMVAGAGWIHHEPASTPGCRHFVFGDITKMTGEWLLERIGMKRGEVECVFGGPPCQGFSISGKRNRNDPRNNLVFDFVRLVLEISPATMVMENVPGILSMTTAEGIPIVEVVCKALEDGDFGRIDMLRRMIAFQTGNVGFMKARPSRKKKGAAVVDDVDAEDPEPEDLDDLEPGDSPADVERRARKAKRKSKRKRSV